MKKVIARIDEKASLERAFKSNDAEFIAVYGRRCIGKTFLIREFFSSKSCIFLHIKGIQNGNLSDQLYEFTRIIESIFYQSQLQLKDPPSWLKAFGLLTNTINQKSLKKVVLFFDELPWLATQKSDFLQALDYFWNRFWVNMLAPYFHSFFKGIIEIHLKKKISKINIQNKRKNNATNTHQSHTPR